MALPATETGQQRQPLGSRYQILARLGTGSMGTVYRAFDRLTGETVALKRLPSLALHTANAAELRLALAREFQVLAGLRHPHILAVREYGFDPGGQPYFTMELLAAPRTLVEAGEWLAIAGKIDLLLQLLAALVYLHRRQLLHRDLKPGNVLVVDGSVKVLDFGLAALADTATLPSGTALYMAPELFQGGRASPRSDLYAVGLLAYELLAGWPPFADQPGLAGREPDFSLVDAAPRVIEVIRRLLAPAPDERYPEATAVIEALCAATDRPLPIETVELRESFLQSAPLTGRAEELEQLRKALAHSRHGVGSGWLVGGESGIGKSRLLQELRTQALVDGVNVLRGQASSTGGGVYGLWREPIRHLALLAEPTAPEVAIVRPLAPEIAGLINEPLPPAPALDARAAQLRLFTTLGQWLERSARQQPLLLLLEDLHWADEQSLALLQSLINRLSALPVLILATYRHDEEPQLPSRLPHMELLRLNRLAPDQIALLSERMLGATGRQPQLVAYLERETEGNTFFLVEILRALAEAAGQLAQVAARPLPPQLFPGGIRQLVQRRLQRVQTVEPALLQLAAVGGRRLDLAVLGRFASEPAIDQWLTLCANAAVLEPQDGHWHFVHDKVREGVLLDLSDPMRRQRHGQLAAAIEAVYAGALATHAADLAYHYRQAGDAGRERRFARLAGEQAAAQFANLAATDQLSRALELTPADEQRERYELLLAREALYHAQGRRGEQEQDLAALGALLEELGGERRRAEVALRRAAYAEARGDFATAIAEAQTAVTFARACGNQELEIAANLRWGVTLWRQSDYGAARAPLLRALNQAQTLPAPALAAEALSNLGNVCRFQGDYPQARRYYEAALAEFRTLGHRRGEAIVLLNLGVVYEYEANYAAAKAYYEQSLRLRQAMNDEPGVGVALNNLGVVAHNQGDYGGAIRYFAQALAIDQRVGSRSGEGYVLHNLASVYTSVGDYATAHRHAEQALQLRQEMEDWDGQSETLALLSLLAHLTGDQERALALSQQARQIAEGLEARPTAAYALTCLGHALAGSGRTAEATAIYQQALALRRLLGEEHRAMEVAGRLAQLALAAGDLAQARAAVEPILGFLQTQSLDGLEEPFQLYLTCYRVLVASGDRSAWAVLDNAYQLLQRRAAQLDDQTLRCSLLENVAAHRHLVAAWEQRDEVG